MSRVCPHCQTVFDGNDPESEHQVHDHFEETFCSYECSVLYTLQHCIDNRLTNTDYIRKLLDQV